LEFFPVVVSSAILYNRLTKKTPKYFSYNI